jgi:hypothetical protein
MPASVSTDALRAHVRMLAGEIGERNVFRPEALAAAAAFIASEWRAQGHDVAAQTCPVQGVAWANLEVARHGRGTPGQPIVVGAHYHSVPGNLRSRRRLRDVACAFQAHSDVPVETLATIGLIPGVAWSDHLSFWRRGYRASRFSSDGGSTGPP